MWQIECAIRIILRRLERLEKTRYSYSEDDGLITLYYEPEPWLPPGCAPPCRVVQHVCLSLPDLCLYLTAYSDSADKYVQKNLL